MNLGLIAPIPSDGTSFYRACGPLSYLARETGLHLVTSETGDWDWTNLMQLDCMFIQRPFTPAHVMVARTCKALNVPLIVDYDDLYSAFPSWCPMQQAQVGSDPALACMRECIDLCNVCTVTTESLAKELGPKCVVVPNALNTYIWPFLEGHRASKVITWRGSAGHFGDLDGVIGQLERFDSEHGDWTIHFLGHPHFKCYDIGTVHPKTDLFTYMHALKSLRPAIHIVPLADNLFNRCKSNIAWLEATAAGAVVIAPDFPEWRRPGIVNYFGSEDLGRALEEVSSWPQGDRDTMVNRSREFIQNNLRLSIVNQKRLGILRKLTGL